MNSLIDLRKILKSGVFSCLIILVGIYSVADAADTLSFEIYPMRSTTKIKPAILVLEGKKYVENIWFDDVVNNKVTVTGDERFVVQAVTNNTQGTQSDVLNMWLPDDRPAISEIISDNDIFALNQNRYKSMKYSAFLGKIYYAEYIIFVVQHVFIDTTNLIKLYNIKNYQGAYYLTNQLSDDPIYSQMMQLAKDSFQLKYK